MGTANVIANDLYEISEHFNIVRFQTPLESIRLNGGVISDSDVFNRLCKIRELVYLRCGFYPVTQDQFDIAIADFRCSQLQELTVKTLK